MPNSAVYAPAAVVGWPSGAGHGHLIAGQEAKRDASAGDLLGDVRDAGGVGSVEPQAAAARKAALKGGNAQLVEH